MTPAEALRAIASLPPDLQAIGRAIGSAGFHEGFLRGAGKLPRVDPFSATSEAPSKKAKR